ncbi:uncharacterized protein LOC121423779 [Lytechinus variegatus]|uniref:uncharacterized protein LOC121423779 n=1 Tax=Lytechinus variegatus TaxID=7654 RepID=UPI001BB22485|nr:uncharacterized protein LOC121423779 [Lytechinus variegatus]XP_041475202.1 uncharacterized protein LOC121423779 [Lytechinus variegatus]
MTTRELRKSLKEEGGGDALPLLAPTSIAEEQAFQELRRKQVARRIEATRTEGDVILAERGYGDEEDVENLLRLSAKEKRKTALVFHDAFFLVLDYLQFYAVVLAIALRWPWPYAWMQYTRFILFANLDIWEFIKLNTPSIYESTVDRFISSSLLPFDYRFLLLAWGILIFLFISVFITIYLCMHYQKKYNLMLQVARFKRTYLFLAQVLVMPVGVALGKVFHCNSENNMDVHNETPCGSGEHIAYMAVSLAIFFGMFILLPAWMIVKVKSQIFNLKKNSHESHLQLKEAEFAHSLDLIWALKHYHMFSSFKLFWTYYYPIMHFLKFIFIIAYSAMLWLPTWQMLVFVIPVLLLFAIIIFKWPFRVTSFNFQLAINLLCMLVMSFMGFMQNMDGVDSVFFTVTYLYIELLVINACWLGMTVLWLIYIVLRYYGCLCRSKTFWPQLTSSSLDSLEEHTRKYMRAILCGRIVLEQALASPPLFSPAHEVARQIQIINAYCREAELLQDPIHDTLWDLLDELIEAHSRISQTSLFAESVKASIRETANEFMKILPEFKKRLAQREYDFSLMTSQKRRMLLKMYTLGVFVNGRGMKSKPTATIEAMEKLYNPQVSVVLKHRGVEGDDGHYTPEYDDSHLPAGPAGYRFKQRQAPAIIMEENEEGEEEDEGLLPIWLRPQSSASVISGVSSINDRDDDDLAALMYGIPSRMGTAVSLAYRSQSTGSMQGKPSREGSVSSLSRQHPSSSSSSHHSSRDSLLPAARLDTNFQDIPEEL